MSQVQILVVEDHPIVRFGIRQMIASAPTLEIRGEAETAAAALEMARTLHPDLAIVDLSLPDGNGLDLIRTLNKAHPNLPILVLSMHDEALFAERALRAGARGYIMKQEAIDGLLTAIDQVLAGRVFVSEKLSQNVLERFGRDRAASGERLDSLTDRELQVFELVGRGLNTATIAARLGVSIKTIETYRANIKTKLDLKDAAELIRCAAVWTEQL